MTERTLGWWRLAVAIIILGTPTYVIWWRLDRVETQLTAVELKLGPQLGWRGEVSATLADHSIRLDAIHEDTQALREFFSLKGGSETR